MSKLKMFSIEYILCFGLMAVVILLIYSNLKIAYEQKEKQIVRQILLEEDVFRDAVQNIGQYNDGEEISEILLLCGLEKKVAAAKVVKRHDFEGVYLVVYDGWLLHKGFLLTSECITYAPMYSGIIIEVVNKGEDVYIYHMTESWD